jgi:hypothetical protein
MDRFKVIYNAIADIGKVIFKYKKQNINSNTEDIICEQMIKELQQVKDKKYIDERNGKLFSDIASTILDFLFFKY